MTSANQPSISSEETVSSKQWIAIATLGKQIVQELSKERRVDVLSHWLAYRIAELMETAEQSDSAIEKEEARQECSELILKVWAQRHYWPGGGIWTKAYKFLTQIPSDRSFISWDLRTVEKTWFGVLSKLDELQDDEDRICIDAAVADLSLDVDELQIWLSEHGESIDEDERRSMEILLSRTKAMHTEEYCVGDIPSPNFAALTSGERTERAIEALNAINVKRQELVGLLRTTRTLHQDEQEAE